MENQNKWSMVKKKIKILNYLWSMVLLQPCRFHHWRLVHSWQQGHDGQTLWLTGNSFPGLCGDSSPATCLLFEVGPAALDCTLRISITFHLLSLLTHAYALLTLVAVVSKYTEDLLSPLAPQLALAGSNIAKANE